MRSSAPARKGSAADTSRQQTQAVAGTGGSASNAARTARAPRTRAKVISTSAGMKLASSVSVATRRTEARARTSERTVGIDAGRLADPCRVPELAAGPEQVQRRRHQRTHGQQGLRLGLVTEAQPRTDQVPVLEVQLRLPTSAEEREPAGALVLLRAEERLGRGREGGASHRRWGPLLYPDPPERFVDPDAHGGREVERPDTRHHRDRDRRAHTSPEDVGRQSPRLRPEHQVVTGTEGRVPVRQLGVRGEEPAAGARARREVRVPVGVEGEEDLVPVVEAGALENLNRRWRSRAARPARAGSR